MLKIQNDGTADNESWTVTDEQGNYLADSFTLMGAIQQATLYLKGTRNTRIEIEMKNSAMLANA